MVGALLARGVPHDTNAIIVVRAEFLKGLFEALRGMLDSRRRWQTFRRVAVFEFVVHLVATLNVVVVRDEAPCRPILMAAHPGGGMLCE